MSKKYDYAVFIGRFQPFHIGHYHVVSKALEIAKEVILVIGSHNRPRDIRNPFTTSERVEIISSTGLDMSRIHIAPQVDHTYNDDRWIASIQASVETIIFNSYTASPVNICMIGYDKDHSSYYLKKFPQWDLVQIEEKFLDADATTFRRSLFVGVYGKGDIIDDKMVVNEKHLSTIYKYVEPILPSINAEWTHVDKYKEQWSKAPYPPTFNTVDAVVTQAGHILLVERKAMPGEGLWALPGGFLNQHETLLEGVLRELTEETKIKVPKPVLVGSIAKERTYDAPNRSVRGRTITHAFHFKLSDMETGLPKVKGSDDARKAFWLPYSTLLQSRDRMFEDHFDIISHMLAF